jgi:alpha-methylacyl-CoA racemase
MQTLDSSISRSLDGLRVLDMTRLLPGPYATQLLQQLGARVDKLEDPYLGDYLRNLPPFDDLDGTPTPSKAPQVSSLFRYLNAGKRSIALNLKNEVDRHKFLKLLPHYDVLIEQFRPGVLAKLGLAPTDLRDRFPKLIVASLSGYGQTGPLAFRAGHDLNYIARAGVLGAQSLPDPPAPLPTLPSVQTADIGGALFLVIGVQAAWLTLKRTGAGSLLDIALMECALPFSLAAWAPYLNANARANAVFGQTLHGALACYQIYPTKDGRCVALAALEPKFWLAFCERIGRSPEADDLVPGPHQQALRETVARAIANRTSAEWATLSAERDICLEPLLSNDDVVADPHWQARGGFAHEGAMRYPKSPFGAMPHGAAPELGEHTDLILTECQVGSTAGPQISGNESSGKGGKQNP